VGIDRDGTNGEPCGDLWIGQPRCHQAQNLVTQMDTIG
jgi:hypothetical protein